MKHGIDETSGRLAQLELRFKKINIVNDQVKTWCTRIWTKFGQMTEDDMFRQDNQDMLVQFMCMDKIITKELNDNREQYDTWKKFIEAAHTVNRFHSTGNDTLYTNTNVRIRPISGMTHGDGDGRMSNISKGAIGDIGQENDDSAFNEICKNELNRQRENVKEKKDRFEEELRQKRLAEERKKNEK